MKGGISSRTGGSQQKGSMYSPIAHCHNLRAFERALNVKLQHDLKNGGDSEPCNYAFLFLTIRVQLTFSFPVERDGSELAASIEWNTAKTLAFSLPTQLNAG